MVPAAVRSSASGRVSANNYLLAAAVSLAERPFSPLSVRKTVERALLPARILHRQQCRATIFFRNLCARLGLH